MQEIRSVAVIGAGDRGRSFALRCATHAFPTMLQDVLSSKLRTAEALRATASASVQTHLQLAGSIEDAVRAADVAIDFVPDELESKLEIFSLLDRMAPPKTILCTPTQLSITDLASCTYRSERCVALTLPGEHDGDVELISGQRTAREVCDIVAGWLTALDFTVRFADDTRLPERVLV